MHVTIVHVQDALSCKLCPDAAMSMTMFVLSSILLYTVGVILSRRAVDKAVDLAPPTMQVPEHQTEVVYLSN